MNKLKDCDVINLTTLIVTILQNMHAFCYPWTIIKEKIQMMLHVKCVSIKQFSYFAGTKIFLFQFCKIYLLEVMNSSKFAWESFLNIIWQIFFYWHGPCGRRVLNSKFNLLSYKNLAKCSGYFRRKVIFTIFFYLNLKFWKKFVFYCHYIFPLT